MHFSKSERTLHELNEFTPPCNAYQTVQTRNVLTGSIHGPSLMELQNGFGLSRRFACTKDQIPGPATYYKKQLSTRSLKPNQDKTHNSSKLNKNKKITHKGSPSIPYTYFGDQPDQEEEQFLRKLLMQEDQLKSAKFTYKKEAIYSFPKQKRPIIQQKLKQQEDQQFNAEQTFDLPIKKQVQKRNPFRRRQIIDLISAEILPSLQMIEIINKRRQKQFPGPGDYQTDKAQTALPIVFTTAQRFIDKKSFSVGPGSYNPKPLNSSRVTTFKPCSKQSITAVDLNHRFYIDPEIKDIVQTKAEIKEVKNPFGSKVERFKQVIKQKYVNKRDQKKLQAMIKVRLKKNYLKEQNGLRTLSTMASVIQ